MIRIFLSDDDHIYVRGDREETGCNLCAAFTVWSNPGATDLCVSGVCRGENCATMKMFVILLSCKFTSHPCVTYVCSVLLFTNCVPLCMCAGHVSGPE